MADTKIWLVEHPTHQFNEDVKALAQKAGLKVVDAKFAKAIDKDTVATDTPKLTKKAAPKAAK